MKELTKKETKMLQGLSVLAMVLLHLFCTYDYADKYTPILYFGSVPLCFYIAQLSDFCVFGFAFCSGYGHMVNYGKAGFYKSRLKGLLAVLCDYWVILCVFSLISIAAGQPEFMPGNLQKFLLSALLVEIGYNGAWWYLFTYAVLVVFSPVLLKAVEKHHPLTVLFLGFAVYCSAYYVRFRVVTDNWLLVKFGPFGMTLFEYLVGAVCYKIGFVTWLRKCWAKLSSMIQWTLTVFFMLAMLYARTKIVPSLFVAPVTGAVIMALFILWKKPKWFEDVFLFVGKHSTNIWLTHMFFYLVLFRNLVYKAKYPVLIFAFMMAITTAVSALLQLVQKPLHKAVSRI